MELYPKVYQIQSLFGDRNLFQYLFTSENSVLVDTGIATTPEKVIFPYMDKVKMKPERLTMVITTHADLDHQGGNAAVKRLSPHTLLSCGLWDRHLVENPRTLYSARYNFLKEDHDLSFDPEPGPDAGEAQRMDVCFAGGEKIILSKDWALDVLHVPGHSDGHLALYDELNKAAFVGDAIHGRGCPKATGGLSIPVTYYRVDLYLCTLRYLEALPITVLYSGHWPAMKGEEIRDFIAQSRQAVEILDRAILVNLRKHRKGLTLRELIDVVAAVVGDWPKETWSVAMFSINGHMDRLEREGKVKALREARPIKWVEVS